MYALAGYVGKVKPNMTALDAMLSEMSPAQNLLSLVYGDDFCALGQRQFTEKVSRNTQYDSFKDLAIVFSGKIYNAEALGEELSFKYSDDAELVLKGYSVWGKEVTEKLHGMFAFAIWNSEKNELLLARDRSGMKSLYYYANDDSIIFASRLKAFDKHPDFKKEFNREILSAYLCFDSVPTAESFYKNVFRLESGHRIIWKDGKLTDECYQKLEFDAEQDADDKHIEEIREAVAYSIAEHTKGTNFASMLSSGVDSSYVVSVAKPKAAYTIGYDDAKYDESILSRELCDVLGVENRIKKISSDEYFNEYKSIVRCLDEPLGDPSVAALYFGMKAASSDVDVVLSGEGADELFCGYNSYTEEITHKSYMKLPYFIRHLVYLAACVLPETKDFNFFWRRGQKLRDFHIGLDRIFRDSKAKSFLKGGKYIHTKEATAKYYDAYKDCSTIKQRQVIDYYFWLGIPFLRSVVNCADNFGLEARFPLLSYEVHSVAKKLADSEKMPYKYTKPALRRAAEGVIPTDAHKHKKLGFPVPLKEWIKSDEFHNDIKKHFESETAAKFFKQNKILKLLEDNRSGKKDCYKQVWSIYTFIVWYEQYFN